MLTLMTNDIAHHVNQSDVQHSHATFAKFYTHMDVNYRKTLSNIIIFTTTNGSHATAEFTMNGHYLQTNPNLPPAHNQSYILPTKSFFALHNKRICQMTTYYNLQNWIAQVSA